MAKIVNRTQEEKEQEIYEFEQMVAEETAALEHELRTKGKIEEKPDEPDPRIPKLKGIIVPEAFRRETVDMAFDALVRLNGANPMDVISISSGRFSMTAYIDHSGDIHIQWKGLTKLI